MSVQSRLRNGIAAAVLAAAVAAMPGMAGICQAEGPNGGATTSPGSIGSSGLAAYGLALDLYEAGKSAGNPLMVMVAATILARFQPVDRIGPRADRGNSSDPVRNQVADYQAALAAARDLAAGDAVLRSMIDDLAGSTSRGQLTAPARYAGEIAAGGTAVYTLLFRGGEISEILVHGAANGLEVAVKDEQEREICGARAERSNVLCRWTPSWTGPVRIEIRNAGTQANSYQLLAN